FVDGRVQAFHLLNRHRIGGAPFELTQPLVIGRFELFERVHEIVERVLQLASLRFSHRHAQGFGFKFHQRLLSFPRARNAHAIWRMSSASARFCLPMAVTFADSRSGKVTTEISQRSTCCSVRVAVPASRFARTVLKPMESPPSAPSFSSARTSRARSTSSTR